MMKSKASYQSQIMDEEIKSPILSIPGISYRMGAMIIAEIGDFSRFDSADKILAYAGMSPSTYQSGQLDNCHSHMEKRGSRYLRYALYNATKYVCHWDKSFGAYLEKKRSAGKHYNVALSHAAKKLVRTIFAMEKSETTIHSGHLNFSITIPFSEHLQGCSYCHAVFKVLIAMKSHCHFSMKFGFYT